MTTSSTLRQTPLFGSVVSLDRGAINVDGTINVAEACVKHNVKRLVHTSTLDVLGYNPTGGSYDERSGHYNFDNMGYNYGDTKREAETRLRGYHDANTLDVVFIYPGFMIGPFDYTLQLGRVFFDLAEGKIASLSAGWWLFLSCSGSRSRSNQGGRKRPLEAKGTCALALPE